MSQLLNAIDQRTRLVGENRLELLLFRLNNRQLFAINVFKVQEVIKMPALRPVPNSHPHIRGITQWRGHAVPVIDLAHAIGRRHLHETADTNLVVTEYNRTIQAFMIGSVDKIINLNWEQMLPPPKGIGREHFLTAITHLDEQLVEILDVERVLANIIPSTTRISTEVLDAELVQTIQQRKLKVLLAEDSSTAVAQVRDTLAHLGLEVIAAQDGLQALRLLQQWSRAGRNLRDEILLVITDAEMPEMDGYRLTTEIRQDPSLKDLFVILHTSLSGSFNQAMVEKVGCDAFLSKFQPDELASIVQQRMREYLQQ